MFWLMKSEPSVYSIDDFAKDKTTWWEGVRNYQARNFMMNDMKLDHRFIFYHSNAEPPAAAGIGKVSKLAVADPSAFNKKSEHYEPKATPEKPIWHCVQVEFLAKFPHPVTLAEIKNEPKLSKMLLVQKGSRLSVLPVAKNEFELILKMSGLKSLSAT